MVGMGMQIVVYAWMFSVGRFYKMNLFLILLIISITHLIGWSLT